MGEHVGAAQYPAFCAALCQSLKPGGRLLIQQMSRSGGAPGGGPFIESYIAPDMHMRPVGETVRLIEQAGFEVIGVQAMREHYVRTIRAWLDNFERNLPRITQLLPRSRSACGACTWPAARWPSRTAGWASTRSSPSDRTAPGRPTAGPTRPGAAFGRRPGVGSVTAAALLVMMAVTFAVALKVGKHAVVDTAWGLGIALVAVVAFAHLGRARQPGARYLLLTAGPVGPAAGGVRGLAQPRQAAKTRATATCSPRPRATRTSTRCG